MYDSTPDIVDALRRTPTVLTTLLAGVDAEQAHDRAGDAEGWSIVEVVCHLRDAEDVALARERLMRRENGAYSAALYADRLAAERDYAHGDLRAALADFLGLRETRVAELAAMPVAAWDHVCQHETMGEWSMRGHALHWVWHDLAHMAQIAERLAASQTA